MDEEKKETLEEMLKIVSEESSNQSIREITNTLLESDEFDEKGYQKILYYNWDLLGKDSEIEQKN